MIAPANARPNDSPKEPPAEFTPAASERDPERPGHQQREIRDWVRHGEWRKPLRQRSDKRHAVVGEVKRGGCTDREHDGDQHAGEFRQPAPERQDHEQAEHADRDGRAHYFA
jgi:hypothetical protein